MNKSYKSNAQATGGATFYSTIEPAFFEQPSSRVALGNGTAATQPSIAVCLCPVDQLVGPALMRHPSGKVAWGRCPSNQCDASPMIPQRTNRFGATPSCSGK